MKRSLQESGNVLFGQRFEATGLKVKDATAEGREPDLSHLVLQFLHGN